MPTTLSTWMSKKLPNKNTPPMLASPRPRVLTPSPSHESLILSAAPATANSAFFYRLPFEIRHKILREALGNRTVHMDLSFDHPVQPLQKRQQDMPHCHANVTPLRFRPRLDKLKPKRWQWWSCECHRSTPSSFDTPDWNEPCDDECQQGTSDWCSLWPGEKPGKCFVGAMGWLLSCRQALVLIFPLVFNRTLGSAINTSIHIGGCSSKSLH
jgi:hypothetical protein